MTGRGIACSTCNSIYADAEFTELCCSLVVDLSPIHLRFASLAASAEAELGTISIIPVEHFRMLLTAANALEGRADELSRMVAFRDGVEEEPDDDMGRVIESAVISSQGIANGVEDGFSVAVESSVLTVLAWAGSVAADSMKSPMFDIPVGINGETASATVICISPRVLYVGVVLAGIASVRRVATGEDALPQAFDHPLSLQEASAIANVMDDLDVDGAFSGEVFSRERRATLVNFVLVNIEDA